MYWTININESENEANNNKNQEEEKKYMTRGIFAGKWDQLGGAAAEVEAEEEPKSKSARACMARTCISSAGM